VGTDPLSALAARALEGDGDAVVRTVEARPPLYVAFMESGRLKVGASDLSAVETGLDRDFVLDRLAGAGPGDLLVLDGNLSASLARSLVESLAERVRIVFEPVSVEKAARHRSSLRGCWLVTPTEEEACALIGSGAGASDGLSDSEVLSSMDRAGIGNMVVTRGRAGVSLFSAGLRQDFRPERVVETPDTTGAGDLLLAGLLCALLEGADMARAVRSGMRAVERSLSGGGL
jgi:sugar/nucleoside kinase (ribokinase family)